MPNKHNLTYRETYHAHSFPLTITRSPANKHIVRTNEQSNRETYREKLCTALAETGHEARRDLAGGGVSRCLTDLGFWCMYSQVRTTC